MKIVVISDTHGNLSRLDEVLKKEGNVDMILHRSEECLATREAHTLQLEKIHKEDTAQQQQKKMPLANISGQ